MLSFHSKTFKDLAKIMLVVACFFTLLHLENRISEVVFSSGFSEEITPETGNHIFDISSEEREEVEASQVFKRLHAHWIQCGPFLHFFSSVFDSTFQHQAITQGWFLNRMTNAP
jgi:hypothetical protein